MKTRRNFFKSLAAAAMAVPAAFSVASGQSNYGGRKLAKFKYDPSDLALENVENCLEQGLPITEGQSAALASKSLKLDDRIATTTVRF